MEEVLELEIPARPEFVALVRLVVSSVASTRRVLAEERIDDVKRIPEYIARAYQIATSGRRGPVVLVLPEDMLSQEAAVEDVERYTPHEAHPGTQAQRRGAPRSGSDGGNTGRRASPLRLLHPARR